MWLHVLFSEHQAINTAHPSYSNFTGFGFLNVSDTKLPVCVTTQPLVPPPLTFLNYCSCTALPALSALHQTHAYTHIHVRAHKHRTDCWGEGQYYSVKMLREDKCLELIFERRESSRVSNVLGEVAPDMRTEIGKRAKAMSFAVEASWFEYVCV